MADDDEPITQPDADKGGPNEPPRTRIGTGGPSGDDEWRAWSEKHFVVARNESMRSTIRLLAERGFGFTHYGLEVLGEELVQTIRSGLDGWEEAARREENEEELQEMAHYRKQWKLD